MYPFFSRDIDPDFSHPIRLLIYPQPILAALRVDPRDPAIQDSDLLNFEKIAREVSWADLTEWWILNYRQATTLRMGVESENGTSSSTFPAYSTNRRFACNEDMALYGDLTDEKEYTSAFSRMTGLVLHGSNDRKKLDFDFVNLKNLSSVFSPKDPGYYVPMNDFDFESDERALFEYLVGPNYYPVGNETKEAWTVSFNIRHVGVIDDTHVIGLFPYPEISSDWYVDGVSVQEDRHPKGVFFRRLYTVLRGMSIPAHAIVDRGIMDGYMYQPRINGMVASQVR